MYLVSRYLCNGAVGYVEREQACFQVLLLSITRAPEALTRQRGITVDYFVHRPLALMRSWSSHRYVSPRSPPLFAVKQNKSRLRNKWLVLKQWPWDAPYDDIKDCKYACGLSERGVEETGGVCVTFLNDGT